MKIDDMEIIPIAIDRDEVFRISTGSELTAENVLVKVTSSDHVGWCNSTPNGVTDETTESILKALNIMKKEIVGKDIDIEETWSKFHEEHKNDPAALAGLDMALYDLKGKIEGKRVFELFDGREEGVLTDRTIGLMTVSEAREHAQEFMEQGFKAIKIKVGLGLLEDIRRVSAVREEVGEDIDIWVDANQAYKPEEAITFAEKMEALGIEFIEQPVHVDDLEGLKKVTQESNIPIMADETIKDHKMAEKICEEGIADMVNIKLMKCGGITGGRKIVEVIEEHGVDAMIGCMGETTPSIAGGTHFNLSSENIKYADLDSRFMLSDNIATGLDFKDGLLHVSKKTGLGIDIDKQKVDKYLMDLEKDI